jgi:23S rRNA-/tRNA-specific pseudouridylate synthase
MQVSGDMDYKGEIHSVHRLDRVTSGLTVFAKDAEAGAALSTAFQDRRVAKCGHQR